MPRVVEFPHGLLDLCTQEARLIKAISTRVAWATRMTIDELDAFLPNGLHDAKLGKVAIDFTERTVRLDLNIWVGDEEKREAYRSAEVTLSGLLFWVSEPPDPHYPFGSPRPLWIDAGPLTDKLPEKQPALPPIPPGAFANWIYVRDWNAFIYVAAEDANLTWLDDRTIPETAATAVQKSCRPCENSTSRSKPPR